ncbi:hypothetical protein HZA45_02085 [Candidatus Peregrinibacteria bacterium]|nr:hypothetical protein [Candidatus Peregrinibacteria bacterium]
MTTGNINMVNPGALAPRMNPALAQGAEVIQGTRGALSNLAGNVSHNVVAPGAESLLGAAGALGGLLTGGIIWKGFDIMWRGPKAVPAILGGHA